MSSSLQPPFEAYRGPEPTIFISYAHKDAAMVYPEIHRLHQLGYHLWYDEGIDPGNEWPEEIAKALDSCHLFLAFLSNQSANSVNCRNEINYALNNKKQFLSIYLEDVTLPGGLALRVGDLQAVMKYRMDSESYARKMQKALESYLKDAAPQLAVTEAPKPKDQESRGPKAFKTKEDDRDQQGLKWAWILSVVALLTFGGVGLSLFSFHSPVQPPLSPTQPTAPAPSGQSELVKVAGVSTGFTKAEILARMAEQSKGDSWSSKVLRTVLLSSEPSTTAQLQSELLKVGVELVEREQLEALMREQNLSLSSLANPQTQLTLGKLMSARVILVLTGQDPVNLRGFDTETSETFIQESLAPLAKPWPAMALVVKKALRHRYPLQGRLVAATAGDFWANLGQKHQVVVGQKFTVFREGEAIKQGERVLAHKKILLGTLEVTLVEAEYCTLRPLSQKGELKPDDLLMAVPGEL